MPTLNYTTIHHNTRKSLGISSNDYMVADLIYNLQNNQKSKCPGWCYSSGKTIGEAFDITPQGVNQIIRKLIGLGLIERDKKTKYLKTTQEWYEKVVYINQNKDDGNFVSDNGNFISDDGNFVSDDGNKVSAKPGYDNNSNNNSDNKNNYENAPSGYIGEEGVGPAPADLNTIGSLVNVREILENVRKASGVNIKETQKKIDQTRVRLKSFTKEEIIKAISNAFEDDFYGGRKTSWKADFDYIFRSDDTMDKMLNLKPRRSNGKIIFEK